ncbi:MAG: hypothetical protein AAF631_03325 [Pseudomonadota bacterium]
MTRSVEILRPWEAATVAPEAVATLQQSLGTGPSRDVIERAAFEVTDGLCALDAALTAGQMGEVSRQASRLAAMSDNIGMVKFASVARDLGTALEAGDFNAIAAVSRRLHRLGEASIFTVVDMAVAPVSR